MADRVAENGDMNSGDAETPMQVGGGDGDGADDDDRKLFVGGLHSDTTADDLQKYMETYGEVTQCSLKTDFDTHRSRCFGFVVFKQADAIDKCLAIEPHMLQGKKIDPKKANPRGRDQIDKVMKKKIFVGRVEPSLPEEAIREYFGKYGKIEKVEMPYDKMKDQRKNYVFIEFDSEEACTQILEQTPHTIGDMEVDVKKPTTTPNFRGRNRGNFRGGDRGRGGRGGGWGPNQGGNWQGQGDGYGGGQGYGNYNYQDYYGNYYSQYGGYDPSYYNYWGGGYDPSYYGGGQGGYGGGWGGYDQSGGYNNYWGGEDQSGGGYGKTQKGGRGGGDRGGGQGYRSSPY